MGDIRLSAGKPAARELIIHAGLALVKGAAGLMSGSAALLADAARSASEAARSLVSAVGLRASGHPGRAASSLAGGTGNAESAVNVAAAVLLILAGLEIAIHSVRGLTSFTPNPPGGPWPAVAPVVAAACLAAEWLSIRRIGGRALGTGLLVLAGSGLSWMGGWADWRLLHYADPAVSLIVSAFVIAAGYRFVAGSPLGTARIGYRDDEVAVLTETAMHVDGVIAVEELRAWEQGSFVIVDAVVSVNPRISVLEGQEIAKRVKEKLQQRFMHVTDVFVRIDPYDPGYPYKSNHEAITEQAPTLLQ